MTTFLDIENNLLAEFPGMPRPILKSCILAGYDDVYRAWQWTSFVKTLYLQTMSPVTAGTVSLVQGSTTVTGSDTSWTSELVGGMLLISTYPPYPIAAVESSTSLTLSYPWAASDLSDSEYIVYKDVYPVYQGSDIADEILSVLVGTNPAKEDSAHQMALYPHIRSMPRVWSHAGQDSSGIRYIRLYPVPDSTYVVQVRCRLKIVSSISDSDSPKVDPTLVELYAWLHAAPKAVALLRNPAPLQFLQVKQAQAQEKLEQCMLDDFRKASPSTQVVYDPSAERGMETFVPDIFAGMED